MKVRGNITSFLRDHTEISHKVLIQHKQDWFDFSTLEAGGKILIIIKFGDVIVLIVEVRANIR